MAESGIEQALRAAEQLQQAGRLAEAEEVYRHVLSRRPDDADLLHRLGVLCGQTGRFDEAADFFARAIPIDPSRAAYHANLGEALRRLGRLDESIAAFEKSISLDGGDPVAHSNLSAALLARGLIEPAISEARAAITLRPDYANAYSKLGDALNDQGLFEQAVEAFRTVIRLNARHPTAHNNLGNVLRNSGKFEEAIAAYRQALQLNPSAEVYYNLAAAQADAGRIDEAIASYRAAIALNAGLFMAFNNLGGLLKEKLHLDNAVAAYQRAIELAPGIAEIHNNLGMVYKDIGQMDEAIACMRRAVALDPPNPGLQGNLCMILHYHPGYDAQAILAEHVAWARRHADVLPRAQSHGNDRSPERRLRIGYVSGDLFDHPVGRFLLPLLSHHDADHFEIICYSDVVRPDAITERFKKYSHQWRDIRALSDEELAGQVTKDQVDILVDTTLHTAAGRLLAFARKPASVQVSWLGCPSTTGMSSIDYRLTDPYLDPPGTDGDYVEQSIRLPSTTWCYEPPVDAPEVNSLPALRAGYVTLGCFNSFSKVTDLTVDLWIRILAGLPGARLMIQCPVGSARQRLIDRFSKAGIDPARLEFVVKTPLKDYFRRYHAVDLCLDPIPYKGHTTTFDMLWMGVPVVTLSGNTGVSRGGASILSNLGLTDLIARDADEYVAIAVSLAGDLAKLATLRATLRNQLFASALMNAKKFAEDVETAYRAMWRGWCAAPDRRG